MSRHYDAKTLEKWIHAIDEYGRDLTEWEEKFVGSVKKQLWETGVLSPKQEELLERIYAEKTP